MEQRITRLSGNNIIEKANGLILATDKSLTCRQLKILDCYLSAINPRDSSVKTVYITKSSLENVLGCKIRYSELYKDLDTLLGSFITVKEPYGKKSFRKISLLYEYAVHMDEPTGEFIISLTCSKDLEYYIFDISKIGYTKYAV